MHINTVNRIHTVLPALATLASGVTRTARKGNKVRLYQANSVLTAQGPVLEALMLLLKEGHTVRIYEQDRIYTPTLVQDALIWAFTSSRKFRKTVTVEVVL